MTSQKGSGGPQLIGLSLPVPHGDMTSRGAQRGRSSGGGVGGGGYGQVRVVVVGLGDISYDL